ASSRQVLTHHPQLVRCAGHYINRQLGGRWVVTPTAWAKLWGILWTRRGPVRLAGRYLCVLDGRGRATPRPADEAPIVSARRAHQSSEGASYGQSADRRLHPSGRARLP